MSFLRKNLLSKLFLLLPIICASLIDAGQPAGGLAAAREKAREAAKAAPTKVGVSKKAPVKTPVVKKPLSQELKDIIEQEKQQIRGGVKEPTVPAEVPFGEVTPVVKQPESGEEGEEDKEEDKYTQTEAHLQLDEVRKLMKRFILYPEGASLKEGEVKVEKTPNEVVTPYLNIVASVINKEVELQKTHYAFYHGLTNQWRVPQDLYKLLYAYYNPLKPVKDFTFVRFTDMPSIKAQDYLEGHIEEFAGVNDNKDKTILPVNLSLFGNVGFPGECTWNYFILNKSHKWPFPENYQAILDTFELSYDIDTLVKEADALAEMLADASDEQTILQIFVPKEKVDEIGFLAWILGFPAHPKSMELVEDIIGNKPWVGQITGRAVKKLMKRYKREGEKNPYYQELIEAAENGDFGIQAFLDIYRNAPWELKNPNDTQARLMITNDGLLNPDSGVKFFTYFTTPHTVQETYLKKLNELAQKIINQNEKKE